MTGAASNINDLLGISVGSSTNGVGSPPATEPADATFSALLSMLSGLGLNTVSCVNLNADASKPNTVLPTLPGLFPHTNLNSVSKLTVPAIPSSKPDDSNGAQSLPVTVAPISVVGLSSKTVAQRVASQSPQPAILTQTPEGKYTILSAAVTEGKLDLHLVNKDNPKAELHITLPADLIQTPGNSNSTIDPTQLLPQKGSANQSTPLEARGAARQTLTDLISQLNITEVAIERAPATLTAAQQTEAASIKFLNAENPATPVMVAVVPATQLKAFAKPQANQADPVSADSPELVESTLSRSSDAKPPVTASTSSQTDAAKPIAPIPPIADSPELVESTSSQSSDAKPPVTASTSSQTNAAKPIAPVPPTVELDAQPLFRTAAVRIGTRVLTQDTPFVQRLLGDSDAAEISPFKLDLSGDTLKALNMVRPTAAPATTLDQPAVRITLPQNLTGLLDNPGRSINIKLEPDYLGPARLTLSMRGESLSAKLTVDTPQAKAAVENSITQLTDQLAKVGIKVDHFDVSMHGGSADNQTFHRPHDWFTPQRSRVTQREDEPFVEHITKVETSALPSATYISRRSVNLYA